MELSLIPQVKEITIGEGSVSRTAQVEEEVKEELGREVYKVLISSDGIKLEGGSRMALKYAHATLEQLFLQCGETIPCLSIYDAPECEYRSFHIDCARHFFSMDELKRMIGMASKFKLNHFHWHFSDDQGWRIESKAYPLLHQIGAFRQGDHFGNYSSDEKEGGYYTREEVHELVKYCESLGIEVVPEIDMPGHVTAILAAYPELSCCKTKVPVGTSSGIYRDVFCLGREETFQFIENLLDDLLELFPGEYVHIGGDETPKERWRKCPDCKRKMKKMGFDNMQQMQGDMANRIAAYLKSRGRKTIVWNEAADGGNLNPEIVIQLWTEDKNHMVERHIEAGGRIIISNMMNSYCDYPYAFISLQSVYEINLKPASIESKAVLGNECLAWSEYIREDKQLEKLCWPRFTAAAEAGWCRKGRKEYQDFANRLKRLVPLFEKNEIHMTDAEGWIPDQKEAERQITAFQANFSEEVLEGYRSAQEEI